MSEILFCDGLPSEDWALKDAERFQRVAKENGIEWTLEEAFKAWETLSLDYDAGWTQMPKEDEGLWSMWINFIERQKEES